MATITRATLRTMIRQRADILGDTIRHPDSQLNQDITDSFTRLQALLLRKGLLVDEALHYVTGDGGTDYGIPDDYLATKAVFRVETDDIFIRLPRFAPSKLPPRQDNFSADATCYRTFRFAAEERLQLYPYPKSGDYIHVYVPLRELTADTDTLDSRTQEHEYIVADVARIVYRRDNLDAGPHLQDREIALQLIEDYLEAKDLNETHVIQDHREAPREPGDRY